MRSGLLVALGLAFGAAGAAAADQTVLSEQKYQDQVAVSAETFTCEFTPGGGGSYTPRDTAWATLRLAPPDELPVFVHDTAGASAERTAARTLCQKVQALVDAARGSGGKLDVEKTVTLSLVRYPNHYSDTCQRYLNEQLTLKFAGGLALLSEQAKALSSLPLSQCR